MKAVKIPITIVTGCLGSGKTTLLSEIMRDSKMDHTAILVNEFGKVGLDHHLLRQVDEETVLLDGGCVCCNRREDLVRELNEILNKYETGTIAQLERVVIETTGLADPAPITFTILTNSVLQNHFYIDCVATTVDAVNGGLHVRKQLEAAKQITAANKVIITKEDLAEQQNVDRLIQQVLSINPSTHILKPEIGERGPEILEGTPGWHKENTEVWTVTGGFREKTDMTESGIHSISFTFDTSLDWTAFGVWLSMLLHARGEEVLRVKGLLDVGEAGPVVLNGVQHIIHPPEHMEQWPDAEESSHLVFIVRSIQPEDIQLSLETFQDLLGTRAEMVELNARI